jgi:energy-coupling factor transporter ATP-binding protein EcfA2
VDQVTTQLEERKFLMLTGASGEGKSSLIYAGLVPNARAGFFKARFGNWTVVDFRPERSPIKNMARALADKFAIHPETIETEMHRGFSSLTDLYLSSDFYIDEKEESWQQLSDADRKTKRRNATNLLVLVDQFEELFTNPENYYNETPSQEAQVLVNLILETSRLALQQNLPIYIVCTMRSDYIGQCSSFRGLPEYIGYSQFFVPRLKRKELKQVIEEPARLSGNRITQRLTDRLVYDLAEGVDQLPILQHALNQIWLMAERGAEEMDLIHYAMVGGMPAHELPLEDQGRFQAWLDKQPDYQQKFFLETGLHKVIENHASRLYESAAEYYNNTSPDRPITTKEAKNIIALTFSCLTKIDNSRAVRNRMTLQEITAIINRPELSADVVGKVVNIFREEGNSFIRPFKTEEEDTQVLEVDVVLDITHESLIRNWGMLHKWANQEFEFYSTFLDLRKQLDRWKENNKSSGYLLPIGPLSYFESWNSKCNPNAAWINRYAERDEDADRGRKRAEALLADLTEFLRKSARHVMISRAFIKYGAQKIALVSSLVILLMLCGFYWYDAKRKKNENVVLELQTQSRVLLASREVSNDDKATYLLTQERYSDGSLMPYLRSIAEPKEKISLSIDTYRLLLLINKKFRDPLKFELINGIGEYFEMLARTKSDAEFKLAQRNKFVLLLAYDNYYNPESGLEPILKKESAALYDLLLSTYQDKNLYRVSVSMNLNQSVQHWLAFGDAPASQIDRLLDLISPLRSNVAAATFDVFYPKGSYEPNGIRATDFNGGYHTLACLYAAAGQLDNVKWCFDRLRLQPDYFTDRLFNNYENVLGYLYQFGHRDRVPELVSIVGSINSANTPEIIYHDLTIRSGYLSHMFRVNLQINRDNLEAGNFHLNLCLSSREQYHAIVEDYERQLGMLKDGAQKDYLLAMSLKRRGLFEHKYHYDRGIPISTPYLDSIFDEAWRHYAKVNQQTLDRRIPMA